MTGLDETDRLGSLVAPLQEQIGKEARANLSPQVLRLAYQPRNMGAMLEADGHAVVRGPCGDTMAVFLRLDGSRIRLAVFLTDGCGPTVACGSMVTTMAQGQTLEQAAVIETADVISALDGLPPEHLHCATLAVNTLRQAIADCRREGDKGPA